MSSEEEQHVADFSTEADWFNLLMCFICIACAALAAGLTMGLLSLDGLKLKIRTMVGSDEEKANAASIIPILEDHHFLLCTLLIYNAIANEALPIFLDNLVPSWAAVLVSVSLVLIFGEVVPTALFTGPDQLKIAAAFIPFVQVLRTVFYPVARPLAYALDHFLGKHDDDDEMYSRDELSAMVRILRSKGASIPLQKVIREPEEEEVQAASRLSVMLKHFGGQPSHHHNSSHASAPVIRKHSPSKVSMDSAVNDPHSYNLDIIRRDVERHERLLMNDVIVEDGCESDSSEEDPLSTIEVNVVTGVLSLASKSINDIYTPLEDVNMLSSTMLLNQENVNIVSEVGNSRLPVFEGSHRNRILGILRTKHLITLNPQAENPKTVMDLEVQEPLVVGSYQSLLTILSVFQTGISHLAIVSHQPEELIAWLKQGKKGDPSSNCEPIGIVTIEDILEDILNSEIYGEDDVTDSSGIRSTAQNRLKQMGTRSSLYAKKKRLSSSGMTRALKGTSAADSHTDTNVKTTTTATAAESTEQTGLLDPATANNKGPYHSYQATGMDQSTDTLLDNMETQLPTMVKGRSISELSVPDKSGRKTSFYKKFDGMFDDMGVSLLSEKDSQDATSTGYGVSDKARYAKQSSVRVTPSMIQKYVRPKRYRITDTNQDSNDKNVLESRSHKL